MTAQTWYVTSAIPYVNADPHLGHALEFVQTDALARWLRLRGDTVRSLWGTDDNAAKNATAARTAGVSTEEFVDLHACRFAALSQPLDLGFDDFIRTSRDPRHRAGVERLWRACAAAGDLYRGRYEGLYCGGCEQFYDPGELTGGRCSEHGAAPHTVVEDNWFFRLSRYAERVRDAIGSGRLRVHPEHRRNEVLAFLCAQPRDISVSRPAERSGGWGIQVPGDPAQIVYVWFDALTNYISALGYGGPDPVAYRRWWAGSDRRAHVIGKGILRFHAAYWPAFLLSAGQPLPTDILVHEYLTVDGEKISKSAGAAADPVDLAQRYGPEALRWWLLRDVNPGSDTDFRAERLVQRHDQDLAGGVGNLVHRVLGLIRRCGGCALDVDARPAAHGLGRAASDTFARIDAAVGQFDFRAAGAALADLVHAANALIDRTRPWELAGDPAASAQLSAILGELLATCRLIGRWLEPFLPRASRRILDACAISDSSTDASLTPLFPALAPRRTGP